MRKFFKSVLSAALAACLILSFFALPVKSFADDQTIAVLVNGKQINTDMNPVLVNNRVLVPMRAICEALGATVTWDDSSKTVTVGGGGNMIILQIGSNKMTVNGKAVTLDAPAQIVNSRTLVPVRAVSEGFGAVVDWDDVNMRVNVMMQDNGEPLPDDVSDLPDSTWAAGGWDSGTIYSDFHSSTGPAAVLYNSGAVYNLESDGTLTFTYADHSQEVFPAKIPTTDPNAPYFTPSVYISPNRAAVAYVDNDGQFKLTYSNDKGKTWMDAQSFTPDTAPDITGSLVKLSGFYGAYLGFTSENDGWLLFYTDLALGTQKHSLYTTSDGGKTWGYVQSNIDDIYSRCLTGANFFNKNVGFMCFRTDNYSTTVFRTADGGKTWSMLPLDMYLAFSDDSPSGNTAGVQPSYPQSPYCTGGKGYLPVEQYATADDSIIYFVTDNGGKTWVYDPSMDSTVKQMQQGAHIDKYGTNGGGNDSGRTPNP